MASRPVLLRQFAKKIKPLYWTVGLVRYLRFKLRLAAHNRLYELSDKTIPPPWLRYRVHGALDESSYVDIGTNVAASVADHLEHHGVKLHGLDILDFGCGPGRIAVPFKRLTTSCRLYGTDIDEEAIGWARTHLSAIGRFEINQPRPPMRYEQDAFDLIYAISLFTHLDEQSQLAWLSEFSRIARPGAMVVATAHGELTHQSCRLNELEQLEEHGFVYRVGRTGRLKLDGLPDSYQTTFHTREYIARVWGKWFDIVDYIVGGLHAHQDVVLLRRRP